LYHQQVFKLLFLSLISMINIKGYEFFYQESDVETKEKVGELIEKGKIKTIGELVEVFLVHLISKGKINNARECEKQEKMLIAGINQMRIDIIEENKLDVEKIEWKKFENELMHLAIDVFFEDNE